MFVFTNFLSAVALLVDLLLSAYMWLIIGRAIISWVNADPYNPIVHFLFQVTEPPLARIRRVLPIMGGGLDFSPALLLLIIYFLRIFIVPTLQQLALNMH